MQINTITPLNKRCLYNYNQQPLKNSPVSQESFCPQYAKLPSTNQYLAFTGGYSLNLAETIKNLDKLAAKDSSVYPRHIREWAEMILESGNKAKLTLIDIHKKYYESLKDCTSLNEAKERFAEFADVLSDKQVKFSEKSFGDDVKKGLIEYFDKDEDLSLQLLKLYYADGFSINDLKQYTGGKDIYYTMKKLNIPLLNKHYGHILKFSDPDYNARLTAEMTYKRRLALDKKAKMEGEPVYIPRDPLSKEHKEHISEGLKRYYMENPERIYGMSERQKDFYRQNPEKSKEFGRVLKRAWNIFGADRIKDELSRFMKVHGIKSFDVETLPENITSQQSKLLKRFWAENEWARKSFSKNMKFAWKKIKEENETFFTISTTPSQLKKFVEEKAGLKPGTLNVDTIYNPYLETSRIDETSNTIFSKYTDIAGIGDIMADTYQISVLNVFGELDKMNLKQKPKDFQLIMDYTLYLAKRNLQKNGKSYKTQSTDEARNDYMELAMIAAQSKSQELVDIVKKALDDGFDMALEFHKDFILK